MDYLKLSNPDNRDIINEFIKLMNNDEDLAIEYIHNLPSILLTKQIQRVKYKYYLIFNAILNGKDKFVLDMLEKKFIDPKIKEKERDENMFFFSLTHRRYELANALFDSGLFNPIEINKEGQEPLDYIEFENDVENDPKKDIKIELFIKILYYYIEKDIINDSFQTAVQYICDKQGLIEEIKDNLNNKKTLKINIKKFKEVINLNKPELFCSEPVNTEASNFVNVSGISNRNLKSNKKTTKAKEIKARKTVIAIPDNSENFDTNYYDTDEEIEFLLPKPRSYGGKKVQKKRKTVKKYKKNKSNKNLR